MSISWIKDELKDEIKICKRKRDNQESVTHTRYKVKVINQMGYPVRVRVRGQTGITIIHTGMNDSKRSKKERREGDQY